MGVRKGIHFEVDEGTWKRWEAATAGLPKGVRGRLLRSVLELVLKHLESGKGFKLSEEIRVVFEDGKG